MPARRADRDHTFHQYTVRIDRSRRDAVRAVLRDRGVETTVYYPLPLHLQPALADLRHARGDFPEAERASEEALSLPMFPELEPREREAVIDALAEALRAVP